MLKEVSERLLQVVQQKRLKKKLEADMGTVETELQTTSLRFAELCIQLDKEKVDVEKLEYTSLTSLFYSVLGSREQQLEKERQELLSAQLAYQQIKHQLEFLRQEKSGLSRQLEGLAGVEATYEALLAEKERLLRETSQPEADEIMFLSEQVANLSAEVRETKEATVAGDDVITNLNTVIKSLESAENWGTWDMLGGGFISTMIKHSHIDDARQGINTVQAGMSRFKRELADVRKSVELQVDIGDLASIADFLFDGLIVDWIVQSKIESSLNQALNARKILTRSVMELKELNKIIQGKIAELKEKRISLLENS